MSAAQPSLLGYHNVGLFSDFFLDNRLQDVAGWAPDARDAARLQAALRGILVEARTSLEAHANEAQTEQDFIRPVLDGVGLVYDVQTDLPAWGGAERPDYAAFPSESVREAALALRGQLSFYANATTIIDAKAWALDLDRLDRSVSRKTPSQQIGGYIARAGLDWGILTNGRKWRLYSSKRERTIENYFEVDLVELLEGPPEAFRYFSCFFTPRAFERGADGRCFLDRVFDGSLAYAVEVGNLLRDRAYRVVELLASGFAAETSSDSLDRETLDRVYANSLILLYRLLFCFYAEGRQLLPSHEPSYERLYSLGELKLRIAESLDRRLTLLKSGHEFWSRLSNLFHLVDRGAKDLGLPEGYDGGLFDPTRHPFLEERSVPDRELAQAIDELARVEDLRTGRKEFVDYGDLKIRDLGTIYEGLLEFRLEQATEPLWLVRRDGREVYSDKPPKRERPPDVRPGRLYLSNERGERRASGSYYTPDYIVAAIVEETLAPLVERRETAASTGEDVIESVLSLRVLDPAMGSGHFLVEAANYLATTIATHPLVEAVEEEEESELRYWRRRVAERCIYGVDLNPLAVELAKLSLWLATVSVGRPLSFLDHHLKSGNSLIGTRLEDLISVEDLFADALGQAAKRMAGDLARVMLSDTATHEDVEAKLNADRETARLRRPFERIADQFVGAPFLDASPSEVAAILEEGEAPRDPAARRERFFHWELAFPDAFFLPDGERRPDAGFDAIVMNPPYVRIQALPRAHANWFRKHYRAAFGSFDIYVLFVERATWLLAPESRAGLILPNKFFKLDYGERLRGLLSAERAVDFVLDFVDNQVFDEATNYTCLLFVERGRPEVGYSEIQSGTAGDELIDAVAGRKQLPRSSFSFDLLGSEPWAFATGDVAQLLKRLRTECSTLKEIGGHIFVGLQTNADEVYIVEDRGEIGDKRRVFSTASNRELVLEDGLLKPLASGEDVGRYAFRLLRKFLLFPYEHGELISTERLHAFSRTCAYLQEHETALRARERSRMDHEGWYGYVYPKNLKLHDRPKLGVPRLVDRLHAAVDSEGDVYLDNVDVNGVILSANGSLLEIATLLNSRLVDFVFRRGSVRFRGSFFSANRQFIQALPIRQDSSGEVSRLGERLVDLHTHAGTERASFREWLIGELGAKRGLPTEFEGYESRSIEVLLEALRRRRGDFAIDPSSRAFRELLTREISVSRGRLAEQLRSIRHLELEADAAVYDLFELSSEERALVDSEYDVATGVAE